MPASTLILRLSPSPIFNGNDATAASSVEVYGTLTLSDGATINQTVPITLTDNGQPIATTLIYEPGVYYETPTMGAYSPSIINLPYSGSNVLVAQITDSLGNSIVSQPLYTVTVSNEIPFGTVETDYYEVSGFTEIFDDYPAPSQLYSLYEGILGRAPDPFAYETFDNSLPEIFASPTPSIPSALASTSAVAQDLLSSAEFTAQYGPVGALSQVGFITDIYEHALGRAPDPSGLQTWENALNGGQSEAEVAAQISISPEAIGDATPAFTTPPYIFAPSAIDTSIARLYYGLLDRPPDLAGLTGWESFANTMNSSAPLATLPTIVNYFLQSNEYAAANGSISNAQFINELYQNALGRVADAAGDQQWLNALNQGSSRATVAIGIIESPESTAHLAPNIEYGFKLA
jgi:hypothetical protein